MKKSLIFFFLFFLSHHLYCQTIIKGIIKDTFGNKLYNINIILKENNQIVAFTNSDENGYYEITTSSKGTLELNFTSVSFLTKPITIIIDEKPSMIEKNIIMTENVMELEEIIITEKSPIKIKKDTVVYDVKSFLTGNEQVVEDILKKIPGISVSSEGVVKIGNREVEKIMVEGDDLFGGGYKILTKNMPANPIEKIELLQHYSHNKHLKGVEESNKVALNLLLSDDAKSQWAGNTEVAYDVTLKERYTAKLNLLNFGKKNKYYLLGSLNNVGEDVTGDLNSLIYSFNETGISEIDRDERVQQIIFNDESILGFKKKRYNLNNTQLLSLNTIYKLSKKIKLSALAFFNGDKIDFFKNSFNSYNFQNINFQNTENLVNERISNVGFGRINLTYDLSPKETIEFSTKWNHKVENSMSDITFNDLPTSETLDNTYKLIDNNINYTKKLTEKSVLIFSGRYIHEKLPQSYANSQFIYQDLFSSSGKKTLQNIQNNMEVISVNAELISRLKNKDLFTIVAGNLFRKDNLNTTFTFQNSNDENIIPLGFQNDLTYIVNKTYTQLTYTKELSKCKIYSKIDFQNIYNDFIQTEERKNQNIFFINPSINFKYDINQRSNINLSYSYNKTNASLLDIYAGYINTGLRAFYKGMNKFYQVDESTILLNYHLGNFDDKFFANTTITYGENYDFISTNNTINQNFYLSENIILKDRKYFNTEFEIDRYVGSILTNIKAVIGSNFSNYKNLVNNSDLRNIESLRLNLGLELRSGFRGFFNYHIGSKWDYNKIKTTISNSFTNNISFIDLSFIVSNKINFQLQAERYFFGNLDKDNNTYYFIDLEARYIAKKNKLTFFISGNNLLNTKTLRNYTITDINISQTEYRLQTSYMLLKIEYRF